MSSIPHDHAGHSPEDGVAPAHRRDHPRVQHRLEEPRDRQKEVVSTSRVGRLVFESNEQCFVVGCDTMGLDKKISEETLSHIDFKVNFFKLQWEAKERRMLLNDILTFIEQFLGKTMQLHRDVVVVTQPIQRAFAQAEHPLERVPPRLIVHFIRDGHALGTVGYNDERRR